MSTKSLLQQACVNEWVTRITEQKSSGRSLVKWYHQNNISKDKFFYRKRLLKDETVIQMLPEIIPLAMGLSAVLPLQQLQPASSSHASGCTACTSCTTFTPTSSARIAFNGMNIELDSSAPKHFTHSLIKAVRYA